MHDDATYAEFEIATPSQTERKRKRDDRLTKQQVQFILKLHKTHNHMSFRMMAECIRIKDGYRAWDNVPDWLTPQILIKFAQKSQCLACAVSHNKIESLFGSGIGENIIGRTLSIDVQGPIDPPTTYGCRYWFLVVCVASGFAQTHFY